MTDTPVSRSLGTTFSDLTGQPTLLEFWVPISAIAAPFTGTTETLPFLVASLEPVAPVLLVIATKSQGQAIALASTSQ
jgi:hypothetical protein